MFLIRCLLGIICGNVLSLDSNTELYTLSDKVPIKIKPKPKKKQLVTLLVVKKPTLTKMIEDRLLKIESLIESAKIALIADTVRILQLCKGVKKYWKLLTPDQQARLLYFEAQALDLAISDLGRDSGVSTSQVIAKYQQVIMHKSSNSTASSEFKILTQERITEVKKFQPYLKLVEAHRLHNSFNGEIGIISLSDNILNHSDATMEMKENALKLRKIALRAFRLNPLLGLE